MTPNASAGELTPRRSLVERYALAPEQIEPLSIARARAAIEGLDALPEAEREMVQRLVYAVGDPGLAPFVRIHPAAIDAGVRALRAGKPIITDVKMVRAGIDRLRAAQLGVRVVCAINAPAVLERARASGLPRSVEAMRLVAPDMDGAVVAIGNAPTALLSVLDLVDAGQARPAMIAGIPVGFVAAAEAKEELVARATPYITVEGTRGGTPLAVAAINTLLRRAAVDAPALKEKTAVLLLGHGSRARSAGEAMETLLAGAQRRGGYETVAWGYLELAEPKIPEGVRRCVEAGATRIVAVPYFLHVGMHMVRDLPRVLREERLKYPGVEIVLGKHIGLHDDLVEVLLDRIAESWWLPPVQDVEFSAAYFNAPAGATLDPDDD